MGLSFSPDFVSSKIWLTFPKNSKISQIFNLKNPNFFFQEMIFFKNKKIIEWNVVIKQQVENI